MTDAGADFEQLIGTIDPTPPPPPAPMRRGSWFDDRWGALPPGVRTGIRWGSTALVVATAAVTRLVDLGHPDELVFDETYYSKDAWALWNLGYESNWTPNANGDWAQGITSSDWTGVASFVVHPPLGKWIIALGEAPFGAGPSWSWRLSTAILGILTVILLMLVARKLTHSHFLATLAGGLLAIDGQGIVMSRVGLLDGILTFIVLLGFGALLMDRDWTQRRLTAWVLARERAGRSTAWGPAIWWRPWLLAAGLALGAASAVKWSGVWFLAAFGLYTVLSDALARQRLGIHLWGTSAVLKQGGVNFVLMVPIAIAAYLASWTSWFLSDNSYLRTWADQSGNAWTGALAWVPHPFQSWLHYHVVTYQFHVGLDTPHAYAANPFSWLLFIRPTSMWYQSSAAGQGDCLSTSCGAEIIDLANPLIWWSGTAAAVYLVVRLIRHHEWQVGVTLLALGAGYLPWLAYSGRTVFQFYTIVFEPYLILGIVLAVGAILGRRTDERTRRRSGVLTVGAYLLVATLLSVYFWPLWDGQTLSYDYLVSHWWFPTWR